MENQKTNYKDQRSCAHAWAHQLSQEGYSSNFFFQGKTIYSYGMHFPIARIEGEFVFFTSENYSKTTSTHKSYVRAAISHKQIVYVPFVPEFDELDDKFLSRKNLDCWIKQLNRLQIEYSSYPRRKSLVREIMTVHHNMVSFINATGSDHHLDAKLKRILESPDMKDIQDYFSNENRKLTLQEKKRRTALQRNFDTELKQWSSGLVQNLHLVHPVDPNLAYLRINPANNRLETSKGVEVPMEVARKFWLHIQQVLPEGCIKCDYNLLRFSVQEITNEHVLIGCHKILMKHIRQVVAVLGW